MGIIKEPNGIDFIKHLVSTLSEIEGVKVVKVKQNRIAKNIKSGLKDAKAIIEGKKKGKTLKQLINEG